MAVNMYKAEVGHKVIFRNGGKSIISRIERSNHDFEARYLCVDECEHGFSVNKNGRLLSVSADYQPVLRCPFDIIAVKP